MRALAELDWEAVGLWLIGVGSLLAVLLVVWSPAPSWGMLGGTPMSKAERARSAALATSIVLVAAGSVVTAVIQWPGLPAALGVAATSGGLMYGFLVWKLHQFWRKMLKDACRDLQGEDADSSVRWKVGCASERARWTWVLRHPLNAGDRIWPPRLAEKRLSWSQPAVVK